MVFWKSLLHFQEEKDSFDPLAEHRTWCSWLQKACDTSPWKQFGSEAVAPWKKILYMVCHSLKDTNPDSMSLNSQYKQVYIYNMYISYIQDWNLYTIKEGIKKLTHEMQTSRAYLEIFYLKDFFTWKCFVELKNILLYFLILYFLNEKL